MTIYVPEDLADLVKEHSDLNVSAVCQAALRAELSRRQALAELLPGMTRHVLYVEDDEDGHDVAFVGKELYYDGRHLRAFLTRRRRIAIHHSDEQRLYQFDSFADLVSDDVWELSRPEIVSAVAQALGEKHVIELDI